MHDMLQRLFDPGVDFATQAALQNLQDAKPRHRHSHKDTPLQDTLSVHIARKSSRPLGRER